MGQTVKDLPAERPQLALSRQRSFDSSGLFSTGPNFWPGYTNWKDIHSPPSPWENIHQPHLQKGQLYVIHNTWPNWKGYSNIIYIPPLSLIQDQKQEKCLKCSADQKVSQCTHSVLEKNTSSKEFNDTKYTRNKNVSRKGEGRGEEALSSWSPRRW